MKKTKLTRSLMAACSIVALSAVMYGCVHSGDDDPAPAMEAPVDTDGDGVPDDEDAFPGDPDEWADSDGDEVGDNADWDPNDATETMDSDGDGIGDNEAAMLVSAARTAAMEAATAAATAATAADMAADTAEAAVMAQDANMAADPQSYAVAKNAAERARTAANAAEAARMAANAANDAAQMAMTPAAAEAQRDIARAKQQEAETAKSTAEAEQGNAEMYARMVADAQQAIDDENQRVMDVADARMAALQSYMDADADATKAETEANAAQAAAPDSPGAMAARDAATAARNAANAAKAAHDAITDGMTKDQADAQAAEAATQAGNANTQYMTAESENDTIQTAVITGNEQQRVRDVMAATSAASDAAMAAKASASEARAAAIAARTAADAAREAYMKAMRARTDSESARMEYMEADAAATAAEAAATAAEMAAGNAEAAHTGIDAGGTTANAQAAQMTAEMERDDAADEAMTASTQQMTAEMAETDAVTASQRHVIGLLINANAQDITEQRDDNSNTLDVDESMTVEELREAAIGRAVTALNTAAGEDDNGEDDTPATASWPGVPDNPDTEADESATSVLSITVDPANSGTALNFRTLAVEDDPETDGTDESAPQTVGNIAPLNGFEGFMIDEGTRHVIVFTDKTQDEAPVVEVTAITARELVNDPVTGNTVTDLGTRSGTGYTGVTYYEGTVADDTDPDTAFTGSLSCLDPAACDVTVNADGTFAVTGFVFTGSRSARAAVAPVTAAEQATANNDYLVFGVWMQDEVLAGDGSVTTAFDFGAFANGGRAGPVAPEITGTATYEGSATGVYTAGSSVDYFQGDAMLEADFGTDAEQGNITGMIDNIVAGGNAMDDVIYLNDNAGPTDNIATDGTFSGDARMGTATTVDAVTTYTHNGSWSGSFFNGTADDPDTTPLNESHVAPGSVAGTFGVTGMTGEGDAAITRSYLGAFGAHETN